MKRWRTDNDFEFKASLTALVLLGIAGVIATHVVNHQLGKPIPQDTVLVIRTVGLLVIHGAFLLSVIFAAYGIAKDG